MKAKEVIKKGELISGTKALYCISLLNKNKEDLNLDSSDSEGKEIRNKILNLLINRVEDYKEYFSLYDGSNGNQNYNDRMKYFNSHIENNDKFNIDNSLSISKIDGIYENNGYNTLRGLKNQQFIARGIWIFPAFLNHSCVSNTTYFGIGDFLFIKAQKDIIKDQEITVGYLCYDKNYDERISIQKCSWGFKCRCVLCVYQEKLYYKKARLYAFNYLQCLSLANTNDFKYINRKKDVDFVDNLQEYKKNVSEQEEKEWINEFCLTPRKFYNFLIENEKEFLKAEMSILLSNYSCFVLNKHHLEDFIFIEITEKAYFYCNNFQINLEVNILVNIVQFYIGVKVFKKAKEYQAKLKKSISEIFGDDIRIQKLFVNANPIVLEKIK